MIKSLSKYSFCLIKRSYHPSPVQILQSKIAEIDNNPKVQYLTSLKDQNQLDKYFSTIDVSKFSIEDIYFYLNNKQRFFYLNKQSMIKMIMNLKLDCYSLFIFSNELKLTRYMKFQNYLIKIFNQSCMILPPVQLIYCISIMSKFNKEQIAQNLSFQQIKLRVFSKQSQFGVDYLELICQLNNLKQFCPLENIINVQTSKNYLKKLGKQMSKADFSLKYYYNLQYIESIFKIKSQKQQIKREESIQNLIIEAEEVEDIKYSIRILTYYPQFVHIVNIAYLNAQNYLSYLKFLKENETIQSELPIHSIPLLAIEYSTSEQFQQMIELRVDMELQNLNKIYNYLKIIFKNLNAVLGLLNFMVKQFDSENPSSADNLVWKNFQSTFLKTLGLNRASEVIQEMQEKEKLENLVKVFAFISRKGLGSIVFWKYILRFVYLIFAEPNIVEKIPKGQQNNFIIYVFQIYQERTIPQIVQKKITKLCLVALANNSWTEHKLYQICKTLHNNRFRKSEIWYAIQNKILKMNINSFKEQEKKSSLLKIAIIYHIFNQMKVGTYDFHNFMKNNNINDELMEKLRQQLSSHELGADKQ